MVALSGSDLSPDAVPFYPKSYPRSYARAAGSPYQVDIPEGFTQVPYHGPESTPSDRVAALMSRDWRPPTVAPTMPYKLCATHEHPTSKGYGSHKFASCPRKARRNVKKTPKNQFPSSMTRFGQTYLHNMDVRDLERAILTHLNIDTLPGVRAPANAPERASKVHYKHQRTQLRSAITSRVRQALKKQSADMYWNIAQTAINRVMAMSPKGHPDVQKWKAKLRIEMARISDSLADEHSYHALHCPTARKRAYALTSVASTTPRVETVQEHDTDDTGFEEIPNITPDDDQGDLIDLAFAERGDRNLATPVRATSDDSEGWTEVLSPRNQGSAVSRLRGRVARQREAMQEAISGLGSTPPTSRGRSRSPRRGSGLASGLTLSRQARSSSPSRKTTRFSDLLDDPYETDDEYSVISRANENNSKGYSSSSSSTGNSSSSDDSSESSDTSLSSWTMPSLSNIMPSNEVILSSPTGARQAEYARNLQASAKKLQKAKKKLKKQSKKKKKRRSTETVFRYLMKAVDSYQLPTLDYKPHPVRRRGAFIRYLDKLKLVTSNVSETMYMLSDPGNPKPPRTKAANRAVFRVLCSRVDPYLVSQLQELQARKGKEDGYGALMLLRSLFADAEDIDYKTSILNRFQSIKLNDNESVFDFNKRFGLSYRAVIGSGQSLTEREWIYYYLKSLREYKDSNILIEVKGMMADFKAKRPQVLSELQQILVREEELNNGTFHGQVSNQPQVVRHARRDQRSSDPRRNWNKNRRPSRASANAVTSGKHTQNKANSECWGCKKRGHTLRFCRTTSEADKKRIYEMHKAKQTSYTPTQRVQKEAAASQRQKTPKDGRGQLPTPKSPKVRESKPSNKIKKMSPAEIMKSYAQAAARSEKIAERRMATASAVTRFSWCGGARQVPKRPIMEDDVEDPFDIIPPMIGEHNVQNNPNSKTVFYEDSVLLDSGASDCMTYTFNHLDYIRSALANVCLADGTVHDSNYQGLMRISVNDTETNTRYIIPMVDTLLVPGLRTVLWSVSALATQGHEVRFGFSTVTLALHSGTSNEILIRLRHPMLNYTGISSFPFHFTAMAGAVSVRRDARPARTPTILVETVQEGDSSEDEPVPEGVSVIDMDTMPDDTDDVPSLLQRDDSSSDDESLPYYLHPSWDGETRENSDGESLSTFQLWTWHGLTREISIDDSLASMTDDETITTSQSISEEEMSFDPNLEGMGQGFVVDIDDIESVESGELPLSLPDLIPRPRDSDSESDSPTQGFTPSVILNIDELSTTTSEEGSIALLSGTVDEFGQAIEQYLKEHPDEEEAFKQELESWLQTLKLQERPQTLRDHESLPEASPGSLQMTPSDHPLDIISLHNQAARSDNIRQDAIVAPVARIEQDEVPPDFFQEREEGIQPRQRSVERRLRDGSLRRRYGNYAFMYASIANRQLRIEEEEERAAQERRQRRMARRRPVSLELMHRRLGHRSTKSILLAEDSKLYSDLKIVPESDDFCETCKISTIRAADKGPPMDREGLAPGEEFFLDIQPNLAKRSLTSRTNFPYHVTLVDVSSRFFAVLDLPDQSSKSVIRALEAFETDYAPFPGYSFKEHCKKFHVDAGSQLISDEFKAWIRDEVKAKLVAAAPAHQEQNGIVERMWQSARKTAFGMLNNARLGWAFFHHALHYAAHVMNILPVKGCLRLNKLTGEYVQSCPSEIWYGTTGGINVGKYRVFGCPCVAKVYKRETPQKNKEDRSSLNTKNIVQRGVRGIFVGFPEAQAGWSIYIPSSGHILTSADVAFDENFTSEALSYNKVLFHDSNPVRGQGKGYLDDTRQFAFTGPPNFFDPSSIDPDSVDEDELPMIYDDQVPFIDEFHVVPDAQPGNGEVLYEREMGRPKGHIQGYTAEESRKRQEVAEEVWRLLAQYDKEDEEERNKDHVLPIDPSPEDYLPLHQEEQLLADTDLDTLAQGITDPMEGYSLKDTHDHPPEDDRKPRAKEAPANKINKHQEPSVPSQHTIPSKASARRQDDSSDVESLSTYIRDHLAQGPDPDDLPTNKPSARDRAEAEKLDPIKDKKGKPGPKSKKRKIPSIEPERRSARIMAMNERFALASTSAIIKSAIGDLQASERSIPQVIMEEEDVGAPGSDPSPFTPVPRSIFDTRRLPIHVRKAWIKAFVKEIKGILIDRRACQIEDPNPDDKVVPVNDLYKCKLDQEGMVDKLKCRVVFRGDLYEPEEPLDPWNPHASFLSLKTFLAICARLGIFPRQTDLILAYLQADMRERVFIKFPEAWSQFLPEHLHKWMGRPLRLVKALYGYNYSGKFLYLDLSEFLTNQGLVETALPGLWVKHFEGGGVLLFLHYSDDIMSACTDDREHTEFLSKLADKFDVETKPRADWYLQCRLNQDSKETFPSTRIDMQNPWSLDSCPTSPPRSPLKPRSGSTRHR